MISRRSFYFMLPAAAGCFSEAQVSSSSGFAVGDHEDGGDGWSFSSPPDSARPYVLWMWMGSNVSAEGITKDLEAMNHAGMKFAAEPYEGPWVIGEVVKSVEVPTAEFWTHGNKCSSSDSSSSFATPNRPMAAVRT